MADSAETAARKARLQKLQEATTKWAEEQTKDINAQIASGKAILKGRTGAERLARDTVSAASASLADDIDFFLNV